MKKNHNFIKILSIATFLFLGSFSLSFASTNGINVNLHVGSCNNDGICDPETEDYFSCPSDCTPVVVPPTNPNGGTSGGFVMDNLFNNLRVEVSYNSATIKWESSIPTISSVKWGTNPDYKDGVLRNVNYLIYHTVELTNLQDGTLYYFTIDAETLLGKTNSLENQIFRTLQLPDTNPPGNPTNVTAESTKSGITVSWENPTDLDFDYIRVMRNDDRFYGSPSIGELVYEGKGTYFTDSNVIINNKYYYSLYSRDRAGNYSSGSLIDVIYNPQGEDNFGNNLTPVEKIEPLSNIYKVNQCIYSHDFKIGDIISLNSNQPIKMKTDYSFKTLDDDMWIEIIDKNNIVSKYLFTRTKDKDGFITACIPSFRVGGYYSVNVYRYDNGVEKIVNQGAFLISKTQAEKSNDYYWYIFWFIVLITAIALLFLLLLFVILPRFFKHY